MNLQDNSTRMTDILQEHFQLWNNKIFPHLPQNMEELAMQTDALQRKRGVRSAWDLLKIFFIYACSSFSFRILACAAHALGISSVSDTAWRKRFSQSAPFLQEILHRMLSDLFRHTKYDLSASGKEVLLVDASIVRQTGIRQNQQRIHLCYSLNQNRVMQIKVTDHHTAEALSHFEFKKGELVLADAGYGTAQNYIYAQEQQADVILRVTPKNFCLYQKNGEKVPLTSLLKQAERNEIGTAEVFGMCRYKNKTGFVRVIAQKLPKEQAEKAKKRKKRKASKNQRKITEDTLFYAGYIVVITSLGVEYSGEEILHLYRSRWQVELLFKRFKQNFSITVAKAGSTRYAESLLLLQLIIWIMTERQAFECECYLRKNAENVNMVYSIYENCRIAFVQIKTILCLEWSIFLNPADKEYLRFLSQRKRWRSSQNEEFHTAILPGLLA